jgi:uncharacterized membrane protein YecN with MAPEG domain
MFAITGLYASILTLLMMVLGARVSILRAKVGVSLLDGGKPELLERIRRHANLTENLPMAIVLMGIAEAQGAGVIYMHAMGLILLAARLVHPFGIKHDDNKQPLRAVGATGTAITMLLAIGYILWGAYAAATAAA